MESITSDDNQIFFEQASAFNDSEKSDISLKLGLVELIIHAIILLLLV